jgi:putative SOS response-associated peptidase YedK
VCNLYGTTDRQNLRSQTFKGLRGSEGAEWPRIVAPLGQGPYIRQGGELLVGQWGMIPPDSPTHKPTSKRTGRPLSTNNARRETVASAWTFRFPWARGQRCLIPADWYQEPYWGISRVDMITRDPKSTAWHFRRADGLPWLLAGLWAEWTDPASGEVVQSYTMLTQNCDGHPILALMHKPEPDLPPDRQDKRAVVPIWEQDVDAWLHGSREQAEALIRLPAPETLAHGPADPDRALRRQLRLDSAAG